jgi:hypothetical protein
MKDFLSEAFTRLERIAIENIHNSQTTLAHLKGLWIQKPL